MSGFLQRLLTRREAPLAPLRRRRPSLFEARQAPLAPAADLPPMTPSQARGDAPVVHTREIHHHDAMAAQPVPPLPRAQLAAPAATAAAAPRIAAARVLPVPPTLRDTAPATPPPPASRTEGAAATSTTAVASTPRRAQPGVRGELAPSPRIATQHAATPTAMPAPRDRRDMAGPDTTPRASTLPAPPRLPQAQRAAAPVAHPARRAALPTQAETPVQVSIGSVEIRALAPPAATPAPRPQPPTATPRPSLDAYLRDRHGGPR